MRISDWSSDVCSSDLSGGRIRAQIRAADARADGAKARYERAVLSALSDSETSISRYISAGTIQQERAAALAAAAEAVELMRRRYVAGEEDLTGLFQAQLRSEEHTSELQSLMRTSDAVFSLQKNN